MTLAWEQHSRYSITAAGFSVTKVYLGASVRYGLWDRREGPARLVEYYDTSDEAKGAAEQLAGGSRSE